MASWWHGIRKIAHLESTRLTPDVTLARTLEKARAEVTHADGSKEKTVRAVYIGIQFWDHEYACDYSSMSIEQLLMHRAYLDRVISRELNKTLDFGDV